jgi:hypothetical protein
VHVSCGDERFTGVVADVLPSAGGSGLWPYPDLAIVEVADAPEHPCVWLGEEPFVVGCPVVAVGHSAVLEGVPRPANVGGLISGRRAFGVGDVWQFRGNAVVGGMSGGPVLNLRSGAVCGIMTATLDETSDSGGFLVPVHGLRQLPAARWREVMRCHDSFHGRDDRWTSARAATTSQGQLFRCSVTATEEAELLGLLAKIKVREDLGVLYSAATPIARVPRQEPWDLRDVAHALMDCGVGQDGSLTSILRLTERLSGLSDDLETALRLRDWTTSVAARLGEQYALKTWRSQAAVQATGSASSGAVVVQIETGALDAAKFQLTVWIHRSSAEVARFYCDEGAVHTLEEVKLLACDQLRAALRWLEGDASVEFVTTVDLFGEPFDEMVPTRPYTNLGRKYEVVLRDLDRVRDATRLRDASTARDWRRRWQALRKVSDAAEWWVCCDDMPSSEAFSAELEQHPDQGVVALTRQPVYGAAREALEVALDSGVPAIVWRRDTCPEHDAGVVGDSCTGARFRKAFETELAGTAVASLPHLVRMIRNRVVADPQHDCRQVVLLWDNPERLPEPDAPLFAPLSVQKNEVKLP